MFKITIFTFVVRILKQNLNCTNRIVYLLHKKHFLSKIAFIDIPRYLNFKKRNFYMVPLMAWIPLIVEIKIWRSRFLVVEDIFIISLMRRINFIPAINKSIAHFASIEEYWLHYKSLHSRCCRHCFEVLLFLHLTYTYNFETVWLIKYSGLRFFI